MSSRAIKKTIVVLLFVIVIGTPLFYFRWGVYPYTLTKQLFFQIFAEIVFSLWLALAAIDRRYRPKWTPFTVALAVFLGLLTLTAIFGVDPARSFWSTYERAIGVVAIYHFAALAIVVSSLKKEIPWKKIFYTSLATSFFVDILARLQLVNDRLLLDEVIGNRPGSTFGNPSFFSNYLLFNIFIGIYLLLDRWKNKGDGTDQGGRINGNNIAGTIFLLVAVAADLYALVFLTQTRGTILGVVLGLFAMLIMFIFRPPDVGFSIFRRRSFYAVVLGFLLALGATFWFTRQNDIWGRIPGVSRFRGISLSLSSSDQDFGPRLIALRAAWKGFLEKPIMGWGPENFNIVFNKFYDPRTLEVSYQETRFDKPHNFAMEQLVSGGVPLLLAFIFLISAFLYEAARSREKIWVQIAIPLVVAYVVNGLFLFETTGGLLMLYLIFGKIHGDYADGSSEEAYQEPRRGGGKGAHVAENKSLVFALFACGCVLAYVVNIPTLKASYNQYSGFKAMDGDPAKAVLYFRKSISSLSPYRWNFERDAAVAIAQMYFYRGAITDDDARYGVAAFEDARDAHPLDAYNHYALIDIYNQVAALDPKKYTAQAEAEAKIALEQSPDRQEVYFSLAKTYLIKGEKDRALAVLKTALDIDPKVADAHFFYGIVLFSIGDAGADYDVPLMTQGYNEIKTALQMGRQWRTYHEQRVTADYLSDFAYATKDQRYLDEGIDLYRAALKWEPRDVETEIKLGVAYYERGALDAARSVLKGVAGKYDFTKSASYGALKPILDQLGI
ncbi:MAG: O-antigen ligase family protein [Candidatus Liptonbacteria bacterium]|nr:O-antigen ligase family protein [Candidatus Liptonbacteria bacterium]